MSRQKRCRSKLDKSFCVRILLANVSHVSLKLPSLSKLQKTCSASQAKHVAVPFSCCTSGQKLNSVISHRHLANGNPSKNGFDFTFPLLCRITLCVTNQPRWAHCYCTCSDRRHKRTIERELYLAIRLQACGRVEIVYRLCPT